MLVHATSGCGFESCCSYLSLLKAVCEHWKLLDLLQTECGFEIGLMDGIEGFYRKMNISIDMRNPLCI